MHKLDIKQKMKICSSYNLIIYMLLLFMIALPYVYLYSFVGKFPAESLNNTISTSYFNKIIRAQSSLEMSNKGDQQPIIKLDSIPSTSFKIERSTSLYYSVFTNEIYAIDRINSEDSSLLYMLYMQGIISNVNLNAFINSAFDYHQFPTTVFYLTLCIGKEALPNRRDWNNHCQNRLGGT